MLLFPQTFGVQGDTKIPQTFGVQGDTKILNSFPNGISRALPD